MTMLFLFILCKLEHHNYFLLVIFQDLLEDLPAVDTEVVVVVEWEEDTEVITDIRMHIDIHMSLRAIPLKWIWEGT